MSTRHFCTYFDHNYLPRAMVMLESLHKHCPHAHVHVLCLSDQCHAALTAFAYPHVSLIRLEELERADPELAATRAARSLIEYYFTITPCLPWYILAKDNGIKEITYLDADMMFFSSPEPIFEEAGDASVIITPHRFSENLKDRECYGLYNVSWLTFTQTNNGLECLSWYRDACLNWCKDELEEDRFADQKYLNNFQQQFQGVHVIAHGGGGVAPWNLAGAVIEWHSSGPHINGSPIIFYHAHGFKHLWGPLFASGLSEYRTAIYSENLRFFLETYAQKLKFAMENVRRVSKERENNGIRRNKKKSLYTLPLQVFYEYRKNTLLFLA
ncbi:MULTISPECIES: hypothetical protein [unclassified Desulfovibrio]|uniref:hypothetical protein n=1 Tax=unclassified Desulfovibrio TaxID=2593640 RepID=UPI0001E12569|nr:MULTISPECIES: hypothetical protein [unclassified Desulfovibrio]